MLTLYRGYEDRRGLFTGFPDDVVWSWVALTPEELSEVRYIDDDYWRDVSGGSRSPHDAISRQQAEWDARGSVYNRIDEAVAVGSLPPEIIVVGQPSAANLVVLEGHKRLTAFLLHPESLPATVRVLLGTSDQITDWALYGSHQH